MSWSDQAAPIIADVISQIDRSDLTEVRRALRHAYPFGERARAPYKAWLREIRRQLGHRLNAPKKDPADPQIDLF